MGRFLAFAALVAVILVGTLQVNAQPAADDAKKSELEKTFLDLSGQRAKAMSEQELATAIAWLKDTIKEEEVERQLSSLKQELQAIAAKYQGTRGGRKAAMALQALGADGSRPNEIQSMLSPYGGVSASRPTK